MSKANLKDKKVEDLNKDLATLKEDLRKIRFNVAGTKGLKNNALSIRKDIARILTELKKRDNN